MIKAWKRTSALSRIVTLKLQLPKVRNLAKLPKSKSVYYHFLCHALLEAIAESMPEDCTTIFVKGLPYDFKEDDIGDRFRKFGEIKAVRIAYNWVSKQSKGFAYITFAKHDSAKKALLEMNNREVKGRKLKIDFDVVQEAKKGYKINLSKEKNKFYNKDVVKEEMSKRRKKEKDKKMAAQVKVEKP